MSENNQYCVKIYLEEFHPVEVGQKISDCEFGFETRNNQYFLSTIVSAENSKEAKRKGELRHNQVLSVFVLHTGITFPIGVIHVDQISGEKPFICSSNLILGRTVYLPIKKEEIEKISRTY